MKKLLHVIDTFSIGGAETLVVNMIKSLTDYENHLIILSEPSTLISQLPANCKRTILDFRSYKDVWRISRKMRKYIRDNKIDIVHSQLYWSNIVARLACPRDIKLFNSIQAISSEASYKVNRLTLYVEKLTYKKRHHIIGVSEEVIKDFDKWTGLKGPSSVLYNMVDNVFFSEPKTSFSQDKVRMVAVGNLRWQKNYQYLIDAFREMPSNVTVDIFGEGAMRKELEDQIAKYKLNITLKGHSLNLAKILREYDIFVMCSLYEGSSLALMEAMAMGLPVFLSDIPVLKEAAGGSAIYFDLKNPQSFVDEIKKVLAGKIDLASMSGQSIARARSLAHSDQFTKKLTAIYES